jgi:hypothetical protein
VHFAIPLSPPFGVMEEIFPGILQILDIVADPLPDALRDGPAATGQSFTLGRRMIPCNGLIHMLLLVM